ncbi:MAG: hypothetical protein ACE5FD_14260, partial [Anaerolineae bacterium]
MSQLISHLNTSTSEYKTNFDHNQKLAEELAERQKQVAGERPSRVLELQKKRNKLLARGRI